jgi:hypothetical protein
MLFRINDSIVRKTRMTKGVEKGVGRNFGKSVMRRKQINGPSCWTRFKGLREVEYPSKTCRNCHVTIWDVLSIAWCSWMLRENVA